MDKGSSWFTLRARLQCHPSPRRHLAETGGSQASALMGSRVPLLMILRIATQRSASRKEVQRGMRQALGPGLEVRTARKNAILSTTKVGAIGEEKLHALHPILLGAADILKALGIRSRQRVPETQKARMVQEDPPMLRLEVPSLLEAVSATVERKTNASTLRRRKRSIGASDQKVLCLPSTTRTMVLSRILALPLQPLQGEL